MATGPTFWDEGARPANAGISYLPGRTARDDRYNGIDSGELPRDGAPAWPAGASTWDTMTIAGVRAPGIVRVEGGRRRKIDNLSVDGQSGGNIRTLGYEAAEVQITFTLWTPQHWRDYLKLVPLLHPVPQPSPQPIPPTPSYVPPQLFPNSYAPPPPPSNGVPLEAYAIEVEHPALAALRISKVVVIDTRVARHVGYQIVEAQLDCIEATALVQSGVWQVTASIAEQVAPGFKPIPVRTLPPPPSVTSVGP